MNRFEALIYTLKHKRAFIKIEKELLGRNTIRGYLHDIDKVILYMLLGKSITHSLHIKYSKHHFDNATTKEDKIQMIIDWECARYTKPDKPLNAYDFMIKAYPNSRGELEKIMKELNIIK